MPNNYSPNFGKDETLASSQIKSFPGTLQQCMQACDSMENCVGFSRKDASASDPLGYCSLKNTSANLATSSDWSFWTKQDHKDKKCTVWIVVMSVLAVLLLSLGAYMLLKK